jgi:hypothetical protein
MGPCREILEIDDSHEFSKHHNFLILEEHNYHSERRCIAELETSKDHQETEGQEIGLQEIGHQEIEFQEIGHQEIELQEIGHQEIKLQEIDLPFHYCSIIHLRIHLLSFQVQDDLQIKIACFQFQNEFRLGDHQVILELEDWFRFYLLFRFPKQEKDSSY